MFRLLFSPLRMIRLGVRLAGVRNTLLLAIGVGIGLLVAPRTGAEMRKELSARLEARRGGPTPTPAAPVMPPPSPEGVSTAI